MTRKAPLTLSPSIRREVAFVAVATVIGALVRIWALGRLGLVHFDEGVYAISGLWAIGPGGLAGLDPVIFPYAPPGFPILVGLAYKVFGASDVAAILVSVTTGALAVPASAWLARRTFGAGAGAPAAALAALSGFHVAFSRMALTDASFLLVWLVGLIIAQRFLERPGAASGVALGVAVGAAQLFKYSGWTLGAVVPLSAVAIAVCDPSRRGADYQRRVWGFGVLAAATSALVYAPWFAFVENHGGYRGLLAHHGGYVGSLDSWFGHWRLQLEQASALSGGWGWNLAAWLPAIAGAILARPDARAWTRSWRGLVFIAMLTVAVVAPTFLWWLGLGWLVFPGRDASPGRRLLGVAWLGLSILTPFYHPYARLWLPIQSLGWIAGAGAIAGLIAPQGESMGRFGFRSGVLIACGLAALVQGLVLMRTPSLAERGMGLLAPTDSLRNAVARALGDSPRENPKLRLLVRPPVTFYIGGRAEARIEPDLDGLLRETRDGAWALVDLAQLGQSGDLATTSTRLLERWEKVGVYPTSLNLPTLLDVDPGAARRARPADAEAPLWLLRPRRSGGER
ncbi:ArnT family glycosyltransferase [Paludisphaera borealis]|uniref:Glycosyltransferase RgtA/B/C/D-like domain-containing protein n=1 Tax=Paludisphaera borealis TaxID=1387353 RepID=A0A1U7CPY4_9BACT|nr:glycosyltransferase family 39 protein [Paludisphaera borealis]APW61005.1 hypothetical protein BSF38_02505 [Paludisphaera borealis]